jgi:hypothetical protein
MELNLERAEVRSDPEGKSASILGRISSDVQLETGATLCCGTELGAGAAASGPAGTSVGWSEQAPSAELMIATAANTERRMRTSRW